ncbi:MAG: UvrD-helicase domain-containing protein [Planctomycetaceae bacterium]|jgi:ATP-dependent exoDNAse (exonuclease V) beta subunit|nr:UvrD-helicase domain-containing protein [Planctomycetaceae bacterium]
MKNKIISASAGSGKTFQLTNRFLEIVLNKTPVENILASTFTVKASSEILFKILKKAAELAIDDRKFVDIKKYKNYDNSPFIPSLENIQTKEQLQPLVAQLARELYKMRVGTLDSIFNKLATAFTIELKLPVGWTMVAEDDFERYILEAVQIALKNQKGKINTILADFYKGESKRNILHDIIALAKEYLRIEHETVEKNWNHDRLLKKQLDQTEIDTQLKLLAIADVPRNKPTKDFPNGKEHANSLKAKLKITELVQTNQWHEILKHKIIQAALTDTAYDAKFLEGNFREVLETIGKHAFAVEINKIVGETKATYKLLKLISENYENVIEKYRGLQFDDITQRLSNAVADPENPAANIENLNHRLNAEANHLLLDEFQDTSKAQWNVLRPFVANADNRVNGNNSVFVVGDLKQAIFGWRGGVAEIFNTVQHDLGIEQADEMPKSQRSAPAIIKAVNILFENIKNNDAINARDNKAEPKHPEYVEAAKIWSDRFKPHLPAERNENLTGYVSLAICSQEIAENNPDDNTNNNDDDTDDDDDNNGDLASNETFEAWHVFVAGQIRRLREDKPEAEIGVLVGRNKEIAKIVAALKALEDNEGNPTPIEASQEGGVPLADSNAIQYVLSAMKLADHPADTTAQFHLETSPIEFNLIDGKLELKAKTKSMLGNYPKTAVNYKHIARLRRNIIQNGYGKTVKQFADVLMVFCDSREHERLQKLTEIAYQFDKEQIGVRTQRFISRIETIRVESPSAAKVRVMNYFAAKGLEFDIVMLADLSEVLTKRRPNYVIARESSPRGITNSPAEAVEWVLKYVDKSVLNLLPPNYRKAFSDRTKNEMIEKLSILYVAMTRPKQELLILLRPAKLTKSEKDDNKISAQTNAVAPKKNTTKNVTYKLSANTKEDTTREDAFSATYSGIVCAGFGIPSLKDIAGQIIKIAGNENWYQDSELQKKTQTTKMIASEILNCKLAAGKKHLIPTTPSSLEIQTQDLPQSKDFPPKYTKYNAIRGTALHKCFESVKWLDEIPPCDKLTQLVQHELAKEVNNLAAKDIVDDFNACCQRASIAGILSKSKYSEDVDVELERRFAVRDVKKGELLHGSIDRLVIRKHNDQIIALEIYDYKSGNTNPDTYKPQLEAYKRAIGLLYKDVKDIKAFLVYVEKDQDNIIPI